MEADVEVEAQKLNFRLMFSLSTPDEESLRLIVAIADGAGPPFTFSRLKFAMNRTGQDGY